MNNKHIGVKSRLCTFMLLTNNPKKLNGNRSSFLSTFRKEATNSNTGTDLVLINMIRSVYRCFANNLQIKKEKFVNKLKRINL